jgi:endo-1,3-1,4-beta-glycanase ExoK
MRFCKLAAIFVLCASLPALADDARGFKESFLLANPKRWQISSGWSNGPHQACEWRAEAIMAAQHNLRMTISDRENSTLRPTGCAEIHTGDLLGFGLFEARMRTAAGPGLNTAFFTYIGPPTGNPEHDEIDFEFLGKDPHTVQINHFTKAKPYDTKVIQLGFDASQGFHDYAIDWQPDKISWYVDKKLVAETPPGSPIGPNPGRLYLSLWAGAEGEDSWLGHFTYTQPVTADVEWAAFTPTGQTCAFPESLSCKK